ncbi:hypothetical protein Tco_1482958 [Tanacetum coccineum]
MPTEKNVITGAENHTDDNEADLLTNKLRMDQDLIIYGYGVFGHYFLVIAVSPPTGSLFYWQLWNKLMVPCSKLVGLTSAGVFISADRMCSFPLSALLLLFGCLFLLAEYIHASCRVECRSVFCDSVDIAGCWSTATSHFVLPTSCRDAAGDDDCKLINCGSAAEAPLAPHSPPVSPVREPTPEQQPLQLTGDPALCLLYPSPIKDHTPEACISTYPASSDLNFEEPLVLDPEPRPSGYCDPDVIAPFFLAHSQDPLIDRCMGRIDSLETELGTSKKVMGVEFRSAAEGDVEIQDDIDLDGLHPYAIYTSLVMTTAGPSRIGRTREEEEVSSKWLKRSSVIDEDPNQDSVFPSPHLLSSFKLIFLPVPSIPAEKERPPYS